MRIGISIERPKVRPAAEAVETTPLYTTAPPNRRHPSDAPCRARHCRWRGKTIVVVALAWNVGPSAHGSTSRREPLTEKASPVGDWLTSMVADA